MDNGFIASSPGSRQDLQQVLPFVPSPACHHLADRRADHPSGRPCGLLDGRLYGHLAGHPTGRPAYRPAGRLCDRPGLRKSMDAWLWVDSWWSLDLPNVQNARRDTLNTYTIADSRV